MCCCCCPPAITALFYLWVRSGFSKGSVAGALTFFPPDPPHYKFQRVGKDGKVLPDDDNDDEVEEDIANEDDGDADDDSDLGTFEIDTKSSHPTTQNDNDPNEVARKKQQRQRQQQRQKEQQQQQQQQQAASASQDPIVAMTQRSKKLRARAKHRATIDSSDSRNDVTYNFIPNEAVVGKLPSFHGTIHPIKIGPQKKTGTYIAALLYKLPSSECNTNTKTILYSHGNATDIGAMASLQCVIAKNVKCHVLVYDYSGYGESGGIPMEKNTYRDVKMVYEWVVANITHHERNVILYGQSVGSGPSCYLASRREHVGGLILHSPFTSGMRVLTPSRALACLDIFPNIDRIAKVQCPVFIIHGKKDQEVAFEHGLALQAAVPEEYKTDPWWVSNKGHNDVVDGNNIVDYIQRLNRFVRHLDAA
ncbi:hypothetical protein ACHAXH_009089 [Discostella pseudostelligera]